MVRSSARNRASSTVYFFEDFPFHTAPLNFRYHVIWNTGANQVRSQSGVRPPLGSVSHPPLSKKPQPKQNSPALCAHTCSATQQGPSFRN